MAARVTPSKGGKPDKIMRDALSLELNVETDDPINKGKKLKRLRLVMRKLVDKAEDGDVSAIREIIERMDGKVPQALVGDKDEPPIQVNITGKDAGLL